MPALASPAPRQPGDQGCIIRELPSPASRDPEGAGNSPIQGILLRRQADPGVEESGKAKYRGLPPCR